MNKLLAAFLVLSAFLSVSLTAQDRMPVIPPEKMTEAQKKAVQDYKDLRKVDLAGPPWSGTSTKLIGTTAAHSESAAWTD